MQGKSSWEMLTSWSGERIGKAVWDCGIVAQKKGMNLRDTRKNLFKTD